MTMHDNPYEDRVEFMDRVKFMELYLGRFDPPAAVPVVTGKRTRLPHPNHADPVWNQMQTVYGAEVDGLEYVYDDRLMLWDHDAWRRGIAAADAAAPKRTVAWWEAHLNVYYGHPVDVVHIQAAANLASGHPYYLIGWRKLEPGGAS